MCVARCFLLLASGNGGVQGRKMKGERRWRKREWKMRKRRRWRRKDQKMMIKTRKKSKKCEGM